MCSSAEWLPVKTRDARGPEAGTKEAMLHCCEDWSEDAFAHKPNKYCTYNLAPKCGPYSLAPRLVHGRNKNSLRGTHNATRYVSCIYRAHDYRACPVHVTSSFPKRYVLQHIAICSDIYRFTKHSFWLTTSQVSRTRLKLRKVTRELYSTWRWVQAATWIQPHNVFFSSTKHVH